MTGKMNAWAVLLLSLSLAGCGAGSYTVPARGISQDMATAHFNGGAATLRQTVDFRDSDLRR
jgi:hypothetical protein